MKIYLLEVISNNKCKLMSVVYAYALCVKGDSEFYKSFDTSLCQNQREIKIS